MNLNNLKTFSSSDLKLFSEVDNLLKQIESESESHPELKVLESAKTPVEFTKLSIKHGLLKFAVVAAIIMTFASCAGSHGCPRMNWSDARRAYLR